MAGSDIDTNSRDLYCYHSPGKPCHFWHSWRIVLWECPTSLSDSSLTMNEQTKLHRALLKLFKAQGCNTSLDCQLLSFSLSWDTQLFLVEHRHSPVCCWVRFSSARECLAVQKITLRLNFIFKCCYFSFWLLLDY